MVGLGLSSRQKSIMVILTQFTAKNPITVSALSEKMKLSSRTILREMPLIEKWLEDRGFCFVRKPGVGLILEETLERRQELLLLLENQKVSQFLSKEERVSLILGELLLAKEPFKSFYFTSKFKISDGTLSNDLDEAQKQLLPFDVSIVRKQGLGITLKGGEKNYRQAIAHLLYNILDEKEMIEILSGRLTKLTGSKIELSVQNRLLNLLDAQSIQTIEAILISAEEKLQIKYTDSAYIALIVHIALAIKRIENNENISMDEKSLSELKLLPEFLVSATIAAELESAFQVKIPDDEIGYITMHLKGSKLRLSTVTRTINIDQINLFQIAKDMTNVVEKELHVELNDKISLTEGLCGHLGPAVSRMAMKLKIKNPQMQEIMENYSEVYEAAKKACDILKSATAIEEIPTSEVAYIAMHFGAALERNGSFTNSMTVAIVCPTGIGTSKMLAANIKKHFPELVIGSIISAIHINVQKLLEDGIDFVISTVELNIDYQNIYVSPLLLEEDRNHLKEFMKGKKRKKIIQKKQNNPQFELDDMKAINNLGTKLISLVEHITLLNVDHVNTVQELIQKSSELLGKSEAHIKELIERFSKREKLGSTYIEEYEMLLLHCKTSYLKECRFCVLRLSNQLSFDNKIIKGAILLLAPEGDKTSSELIGEISSALIENTLLKEAVCFLQQEDIRHEAQKSLCSSYLKILKNRLERFGYEKSSSEIW